MPKRNTPNDFLSSKRKLDVQGTEWEDGVKNRNLRDHGE